MKKRIDEGVAFRLKEFRKLLGLSQKELAQAIGFSQRAVSHWEKAESDIPTVALRRLKDKLGLNIDWLLTGEGEPFVRPKEEKKKGDHKKEEINEKDRQLLELIKSLPPKDKEMIFYLLKKVVTATTAGSTSLAGSKNF
jgi:transcriptional regulator with XRE-family HTH domain